MTLRYEVVPGNGLVARDADSILWVGEHTEPIVWEALGALLQLQPGTDPAGADTAALLGDLQRTLEQYPQTMFAALIVAGERAQGLLRGPVTVRNQTDVAPAVGHGQLGITVPFEMSEAVFVGFHQPFANPDPIRALLDLDAGIVPGGGAWVHPLPTGRRHAPNGTGTHPRSEPLQTQPPEGEPAASPTTAGYPAPPAAPVAPGSGVPPLPAVSPAGAWASPADPAAGIVDSTSAAPAAAEAPAADEFSPAPDYQRVDLRTVSAQSPAPPLPVAERSSTDDAPQHGRSLGAIVFEDGSTFALDRDYVVGRRPEKDQRVQSGQAAALTVVDPDTVLSSAHALLAIHGDGVRLTDLGSLNGTHIAPPGAADWTRLAQFQEVPITPGTRLLFGWTVATFSGTS